MFHDDQHLVSCYVSNVLELIMLADDTNLFLSCQDIKTLLRE